MSLPTIREMFDAGLHFGHKRQKTDPRARKFTYALRDGIYVIDLGKTRELLEAATKFMAGALGEGGKILFVGTKPQAQVALREAAEALGMPYVSRRWIGGTLTNFDNFRLNLRRLNDMEAQLAKEDSPLTKQEKLKLSEKVAKLRAMLDGTITLERLPVCLFVVDTEVEKIAISEAKKNNIPVVGVCDTNANPDVLDWPIPANDNSSKAIKLLLDYIAATLKPKKAGEKK